MNRIIFALAIWLAPIAAFAQPACLSSAPNAPACQASAVNLQPADILVGQQATGPGRANQTVRVGIGQMFASPPAIGSTTPAAGAFTTLSGSVTATGSTTARPLAAWEADLPRIYGFGAAGNGATNDTSAFNAANTNGKPFLLPSGSYYLDGTLVQSGLGVFAIGNVQTTGTQGLSGVANGSYWNNTGSPFKMEQYLNAGTQQSVLNIQSVDNEPNGSSAEIGTIYVGTICEQPGANGDCVSGIFQASAASGNMTASLSTINPYATWAAGTQGGGSGEEIDVTNSTGTDDAWPASLPTSKSGLWIINQGSNKATYGSLVSNSGAAWHVGYAVNYGATDTYDLVGLGASTTPRWYIDNSGNISGASATLGAPLPIGSGGTGASNASGARYLLGAAASGANSDISAFTPSGGQLVVNGQLYASTGTYSGGNVAISSNGSYVQWNRGGGDGGTWIVNQKGGGAGGTYFGEVTTGNVFTQSGYLSPSGQLAISSITLTPYTSSSIGGSALLAGACASTTVSITGLTTAMALITTPVTYPGDGTFWHAYASAAGTATVKICESVAGTPTASTYNIRVIQ